MKELNKNEYRQSVVDDFFEHSYHDRGRLKWQGFYLSDHTTALNKEKTLREKKIEYRSQQTLEEISKVLLEAYTKNKTVEIQLNNLDQNDNSAGNIKTKIKGYNEDNIFIENDRFVSIEDIRNIQLK